MIFKALYGTLLSVLSGPEHLSWVEDSLPIEALAYDPAWHEMWAITLILSEIIRARIWNPQLSAAASSGWTAELLLGAFPRLASPTQTAHWSLLDRKSYKRFPLWAEVWLRSHGPLYGWVFQWILFVLTLSLILQFCTQHNSWLSSYKCTLQVCIKVSWSAVDSNTICGDVKGSEWFVYYNVIFFSPWNVTRHLMNLKPCLCSWEDLCKMCYWLALFRRISQVLIFDYQL